MGDSEIGTESDEDLWAAASEDLQKQKEMLRDAATGKPVAAATPVMEAPPAPAPVAHAPAPATGHASELKRILDIQLQVTVELGHTKMLINDLLQLGQGSVIELTKLVGEPLDVLVNNKAVAKAEVVVVNEKFGIRITEVLSPQERIETLG